MKIRVGLIGLGRISYKHIEAIKNSNQAEIVAVCDLLPEAFDEKVSKGLLSSNIRFYTNYLELFDNNDLDLVSICTDSGSHAEIALASLKKGINTLVEKPIALSMFDARKMINLAKEKAVLLSVCHQNRFNLAIEHLFEAYKNKLLGKISHLSGVVRWNRTTDYYKQADWRGKWISDGGCLMNQCIHNADIISYLLGDIEELSAYTANRNHPYLEVEDVGISVIKSKNGVLATFEGTVNVYPENLEETISVFGSTGTVKIGGKSLNEIEVWNIARQDNDINELNEIVDNVYGNGHLKLYQNLLHSIQTNSLPLITGEDGIKALELILAIYKSQKTGKPVKFPLDNFSTLDMEE